MNKMFLFQSIFLPLTLQKIPKRYYTSILEQRIIPYFKFAKNPLWPHLLSKEED